MNDNRKGGGGRGSDGSCHYSVLGIGKEASLSDIRAAYRKLALKWHPDRLTKDGGGGDANANCRFQRIQEAYSVLSDEGKRSMYDAAGTLDLDLFDLFDEDDEGMGEFMHDLLKMIDNNNKRKKDEVRKEETLEDLQRCFMETFGATYLTPPTTTTTTVHQDHQHQHPNPKTTSTNSSRSSYASSRPPPKTYRKKNRATSTSTSTTSSPTARC